jgi:hypothetical protein
VFPQRNRSSLSNQTALDSGLTAVEKTDLFLCVIAPQYGSGVVPEQLGFTHQELLKAIKLDKPRWILAHHNVPFARSLIWSMACEGSLPEGIEISRTELAACCFFRS